MFNPFKDWKKSFADEGTKFMLWTGVKVTAVSLIVSILLSYLIWLIVSVNGIFFEVSSFSGFESLRESYADYIFAELVETSLPILGFFAFLFFSGVYLGKILLRPFMVIGDYCERVIDEKETPYEPDRFSDFRLLTRFSDFFFAFALSCREQKALRENTIPPQFLQVRKPVFDNVFFFHFLLYTAIVCSISVLILSNMAISIYENIVSLAITHIKVQKISIENYISSQSYLIESIIYMIVSLMGTGYMALSFHLYGKVSGAAFGFFATMKSFMKGNYKARVHLIGYNQVRPYSRAFNKYLDYLERNFADQNNPKKMTPPITLANNE